MHTTLSTKGQVVIPAKARQSAQLLPGARLSVEVIPDGLLLRLVTGAGASERYPGVPSASFEQVRAGFVGRAKASAQKLSEAESRQRIGEKLLQKDLSTRAGR